MKKNRIISLSLANILLTGAWIIFLHDGALYQLREAPERPLAAMLSLFLTLALLSEGLYWTMHFANKSSKKVKGIFYGLFILVLLIPLNQIRTEVGITWRIPPSVSSFMRNMGAWRLLAILGVGLIPYLFLCIKVATKLAKGVKRTALILSPALFVCITNTVWTWKNAPLFQPRHRPNAIDHSASDLPRVLVLLFDELDKRLIFENRPAGIEYPAFDRFVKESTGVKVAFSPGPNTVESVPGLLIGQDIKRAQSIFPSDLYLTLEEGNRRTLWSEEKSIFTRLEAKGLHTALLGWYHAYCTILGDSIDVCERRSHFRYKENIFQNIPVILRNALYGKWLVSMFMEGAVELAQGAVVLSANPKLDFIFVHLPVPHSPWIYDRNKKKPTLLRPQAIDGYFDNVAFADEIFGQIRQEMEMKNLWQQTTVILTTDHSWRSSKLYDEKRDPRVPFYVKMPDGQFMDVPGPFKTHSLPDLVMGIFERQIKTSQDLAAWLQKHRS